MKEVFQNRYMKLKFHEKVNTLEQEFLPDSAELFDRFYKEQMNIFLKTIKEYMPSQLIINVLQGGPTMNPEVQEWMQTNFYDELVVCGVKRKAYLLGEELIAKLSIKQTAEEDPNQQFEYKYFSKHSKALQWLEEYEMSENSHEGRS